MPISRGSDTQLRFFDAKTGKILQIWSAQDFTTAPQDTKETQNRLGTRRKPKRQIFSGHTGSITFEAEGPELDELLDIAMQSYLDGEVEQKFEIIDRSYYPGRGSTVYRYPGVVMSLSKNVTGQDAVTTYTFDWESEIRVKVS